MSNEVSEAAVEEVSGALARNLAGFGSPQWAQIASAQAASGTQQAAAQLALGEPVEWMTPGIVHRHGKVWPGAILLVTPHRLIVSASRGSIRTKREISSLYRGPESVLSVSPRALPGTPTDSWTLEIATQQGPFLFAIPSSPDSEGLAQLTAAFIARRAQFTPESGTVLDGVPWGTAVAAEQAVVPEGGDPFEAARADLTAGTAPEPVAALPAPDWYPDPLGEAGLRYWDGQAWTEHTAN